LALTLLVVSGLFLRGLGAAQGIDPGFNSDNVVDVTVDLSLRTYESDAGRLVQSSMLDAVRALGDVESAAFIATPPLNASNSGTSVLPLSAAPDDRAASRGVTFTRVSPDYFGLVRMPLLAGRSIESADREGAPRVAVVNESFAKMLWPGVDAVGQQFREYGEPELITVVGLVRDTKYKSLNDANLPFMYLSLEQSSGETVVMQVRLRQDTPAARAAVRSAVQAVDPGLPIPAIQSAVEAMSISLLGARLGASLTGAFGLLALLLATVGVYGVTSYVVGQRTAEIGIRTALGAPSGSVLRGLMAETLRVVGIGVVLGLAGGIGIGKVAAGSLYGVGALDPAALFGASGLLVAVAVLGTWLPVRRALRLDPIEALRAE
jgi:predicted permease